MNCDEFVELVTEYLEGALSPDEERRFLEHLSQCRGCSTYLEQMRLTVLELGRLPSEQLSVSARADLLAAFRREASD